MGDRRGDDADSVRVVYLEPFWGGSHRAAAEGWVTVSAHRVRVESLPARFWKWRMRGAAFEFARRLRVLEQGGERFDLVFATSMVDVAHLSALLPYPIPILVYFHENQASYPGVPGQEQAERDLQYAFTNLASAAAADCVAFNSAYQETDFFQAMTDIVRRMPDARPEECLEHARRKSLVLPLGVTLSDIPPRPASRGRREPVILWNHRWEYDKDPVTFFEILFRLAERKVPFRVVVAGEGFGRVPEVFPVARERLGDRILHWGYVQERSEYVALLLQADVVVSTAIQENFGVSVVEGAYAGAHPLVPHRLSYPEVLPDELHAACLYRGPEDLEQRLEALLEDASRGIPPARLRSLFADCRWELRGVEYDRLVSQVFRDPELWYK